MANMVRPLITTLECMCRQVGGGQGLFILRAPSSHVSSTPKPYCYCANSRCCHRSRLGAFSMLHPCERCFQLWSTNVRPMFGSCQPMLGSWLTPPALTYPYSMSFPALTYVSQNSHMSHKDRGIHAMAVLWLSTVLSAASSCAHLVKWCCAVAKVVQCCSVVGQWWL